MSDSDEISSSEEILDEEKPEQADSGSESDEADPELPNTYKIRHNTLYVQFPCRLPDLAKVTLEDLHAGIVRVRLPRQKKARFCFVDCRSEELSAEVEAFLRTTEVLGHRLFVNRKRKIDDPLYRQKLISKSIERKIAKSEAKRMRRELKRKAEAKATGSKINRIVVTNIPESASEAALRKLFPTCVEFAFREQPSRVAFVTFSSTRDATGFIKRAPSIGDTELAVRAQIRIAGKFKKGWKKNKKTSETKTPKGPYNPNFKRAAKPKVNYQPIKRSLA